MIAKMLGENRLWLWVWIFLLFGFPAIIIRSMGLNFPPLLTALIFGLGIVGGAFLLSWAVEVAQLDISASLAIAILALVAILPEYAIETVLALQAGESYDLLDGDMTSEMARVAANVTGANRLLIGLGWSSVILVYWVKRRSVLDVRGFMTLEVPMLMIATAATFVIFFTKQVHFIIAVALIALYVFYLWSSSRKDSEEPSLVGVAATIASLGQIRRRWWVVFLFLYSAIVILLAAEPFVHGLVLMGSDLGIDEFILIQWIAPLASESPEIIVAILFSIRGNAVAGLSTLISSEVNQLTLLVGSMVVIFCFSVGQPVSFPLDERQSLEFLLTGAMSLFAILLIAPRLISWRSGTILAVLFLAHLFFPSTEGRLIFAYSFFACSAGLVLFNWRRVKNIFDGAVIK